MRAHVAAGVLAVAVLASAASAQETKVVTVGPQYAAGGAQRFWFGDGYATFGRRPSSYQCSTSSRQPAA